MPTSWTPHDPNESLQTTTDSPTSPTSPSVNSAVPSGPQPLARFEFETNHTTTNGTKVLLLEWPPHPSQYPWSLTWDHQTTCYPVWDTTAESQGLSRVYILLPTGAPVPPLVTISQQPLTPNQSPHPTKGAAALVTPVSATSPAAPVPVPKTDDLAHPKEHDTPLVTITVKPLPAIYPANLTTTTPGKRGVLHTIWARLKLSSLRLEMEAERRQNNESIGLEMALQEYAWLAGHFGLPRLIVTDDGEAKEEEEVPASPPTATSPSAESPVSPRGPVSPGRGGRLSEKLKGLKLATSPADLNNPSIKTSILQGRAMSPATTTDLNAALSLNAIMKGVTPEDQTPHEDELFALPMSPRSPEMKRSPFSMLA